MLHLSHFASARKLVYRHNLSIENFVPSLTIGFAVCFMNCSIHNESTSPGGTGVMSWSPSPRNLLWAMYFTTRALRRTHKLKFLKKRGWGIWSVWLAWVLLKDNIVFSLWKLGQGTGDEAITYFRGFVVISFLSTYLWLLYLL